MPAGVKVDFVDAPPGAVEQAQLGRVALRHAGVVLRLGRSDGGGEALQRGRRVGRARRDQRAQRGVAVPQGQGGARLRLVQHLMGGEGGSRAQRGHGGSLRLMIRQAS